MGRWEPVLLALFFASWLGALSQQLGIIPLEGSLTLGLYPFFSLSAFLGWSAGNVYLFRRRRLPREVRRRLLLVYLIGPPGIVYLLRAMAPLAEQEAAPLVPILGFGVFVVFFLVPLTLAGEWSDPLPRRRRPDPDPD